MSNIISMMLYRLGNWFYTSKILLFPKAINLLIRLVHNSAVFSETSIGKSTAFRYGGIATLIHKSATIGSDCVIDSCVTISGEEESGIPITGANAVIIIDIPDNKTTVGIPARIIH